MALKDYSGNDSDQHKFKVLMLRNIAHAAPYIHDGNCQSLEDAVRAMAMYELVRELSEKDIQSIVVFMNTLTGLDAKPEKE